MTTYKQGLRKNIRNYFIFEAFWNMFFFIPIFQLFYLARGLSIFQIALIGVAYGITTVVTEVPSGVLADRWGRKKTLFLSQICFIIALLLLIFGNSLTYYIIAAVMFGLWWASYSGTGVAFFYDTLVELKRRDEYEKLMGRLNFFTGIISFLAALSAGFLFNISITLPYYLTAAAALLSLIPLAMLTEPKIHKHAEETVLSHFKSSFKQVIHTEYLSFIVLYSAILTFSLNYFWDYSQIYFKLISIPVVLFGAIFAVEALLEGMGAWSADSIKKRFSYRSIFTFLLVFTLVTIFLVSYIKNYFGVIIFLLVMIIPGVFKIIKRGYIDKRVKSHNRATIDSISTFSAGLFIIIFEPIAGRIADIYTIQTSFFFLGCLVLVYTLYFFITKFNHKRIFGK